MKKEHEPVMLREVMEYLITDQNGIYVDATFGRGGHSAAILNQLGKQGQLYAIDRDPAAFANFDSAFVNEPRFHYQHAAFSSLQKLCDQWHIAEKVTGILVDCGVSSPQLDTPERGFSFLHDAPLDMRMDPTSGITAAQWLNQAAEKEIADVLMNFGEERYAPRIAKAIVHERKKAKIETTKQLVDIILAAKPRWEKNKHAATRTFQAIRIFINQELEELKSVLQQAMTVLQKRGRLAVLCFHSLEARIVKHFFRDVSSKHNLQAKQLFKSLEPTRIECRNNPRARSATLRIMEKL